MSAVELIIGNEVENLRGQRTCYPIGGGDYISWLRKGIPTDPRNQQHYSLLVNNSDILLCAEKGRT